MVAGTRSQEKLTDPALEAEEQCCPVFHKAIELIGKRWTGAVIWVLMPGPLRFSEIRHAIPDISERLLSERVKELEARGLVIRTVFQGRPVRVQYELSPAGLALRPALEELKRWGKDWLD